MLTDMKYKIGRKIGDPSKNTKKNAMKRKKKVRPKKTRPTHRKLNQGLKKSGKKIVKIRHGEKKGRVWNPLYSKENAKQDSRSRQHHRQIQVHRILPTVCAASPRLLAGVSPCIADLHL